MSSSNNVYVNWIEEAISGNFFQYYKFEDFKNVEQIGTCDNVGNVYRANWKNWRQFFGLKHLNVIKDIAVKELVNELKLHRKVDFHDNIINFHGVTEVSSSDGKYLLVVDYADGGSLKEYLRKNFNKLTWNNKFQLAYQLTNVMSYLHYEGIVHRDLHSGNVLIHQGNIKLADFGLSRKIRGVISKKEPIDLVPYIDPKRLADQLYSLNEKSDVYSVGVLLWEISSGRSFLHNSFNEVGPYKMNSNLLVLRILQGQRGDVVPDTPKDYVKIYKECWDGEPNNRPNMRDVTGKLKEIINNSNLISEIIEFIFKITNLGKGKILGIYVNDYFNNNNINAQGLYDWLLNNHQNSNSIFLLGYLNFYGIGTELSYNKAFESFSAAYKDNTLEQSHTLTLYYLGLCYQYGRGTDKNDELAFGYFKILAERGYAMGYAKLGLLFSQLNQHQLANKWYKKAADNGNVMAMYNIARRLIACKDYVNAIELLVKSANEDYVEAINTLGFCYEEGNGVELNPTKAAEMYLKAARMGSPVSQFNIARMLDDDSKKNNKENLALAIIWYKKAADQGDRDAYDALNRYKNCNITRESLKKLDNQENKRNALLILNSI
ncbi:hypothetical protein RclHR1_07400008 [Rhizophagus clarus]|uniref:Kinase-like domain-containing protein n=1 Tax=Rhizophagus clarus TaxID=94130 RepID=A0A2Z6RYM2_9GLOM|nr:hypothetical protein RclHR1_07400008 [Rhizophagus clarus]GET04763.1 kinase-like domain-containing protein [Rhizophagus clarus]